MNDASTRQVLSADAGPQTVDQLIDSQPISRVQIRGLAICCLIAACDGIDSQALALAAPALRRAWDLGAGETTMMLAAAPVGMLAGGLLIGPASDLVGRRWTIIWSTLIFGLCTLALTVAPNWNVLCALRLVAGVGMGGAVVNVVTLSAELAPQRRRSAFVTLAFCGVPGGALIAALIALWVTPRWGAPGLFAVAGALPLIILPLAIAGLPESVRFLAAQNPQDPRIGIMLRSMFPKVANFHVAGADQKQPARRAALGDLFSQSWLVTTLCLWVAYISALLVIHFLSNWLPNILVSAGFSERASIMGMVFLNSGAVIGGLTIGQLMDRFGSRRVLSIAYGVAAIAVTCTPLLLKDPPALMAALTVIGTLVLGGQVGMNALAAATYPTALRGTGVGWASGLGRAGAILGPSIGGVLLATAWGADRIFLVIAAALAACCAALVMLGLNRARQEV